MGDVRLDAELVKAEIQRLKSAYPELADDADLLASTIEGETSFDRVMDKLAQVAIEARAMSDGLGTAIGSFKTRQQRFDKKAAAMRGMALALMEAAEQQKVVTPAATLWTRDGGTSVVVDDPNQLPQGYYSTERVPDKTAIKAALEKGDALPGAHLEYGNPSISIRTN